MSELDELHKHWPEMVAPLTGKKKAALVYRLRQACNLVCPACDEGNWAMHFCNASIIQRLIRAIEDPKEPPA